jgi:hypothetical protein
MQDSSIRLYPLDRVIPVPISDLDIRRAANLWIQQHGEHATPRHREIVEEMRCKGDADGADMWLRIVVSIGTLGTPPTDAKH